MFNPNAAFRVVSRRALSLLVFALLLPACSIVRQPTPEEYESVRQNQKAIVLFRLTGSLDNKEVHVLLDTVGGYPNYTLWSFGLANLDAGEPMRVFPVKTTVASWVPSYPYFSPGTEVAESGWGAFLLEPGAYYLRITSFPRGVIEPIPEFRFTVPPNVSLVYIGSLHITCTTFENVGWYGTRGFAWGSCLSDSTVANEDGAAMQVAQTSLKEFGQPLSAIMQRYPSTPLVPGTLTQIAPVGLLVPRGKIDVGSPEWMNRAIGIGLLPSAGLLALAVSAGGGGAPGPGLGAAVFLAIAWAPVGTVLGYLGGKFSESSWEPCRQALQESISKFDPMATLGAKLKAALNHEEVSTLEISAGADAEDETVASVIKSIISAQITRVVLRFCPLHLLSTPLCLDVATHATLFDMTTKRYVYDRVLVYSGAQLELQPYEALARHFETVDIGSSTTLSSSRELEAYCGEGGGEILQADLSNALDAIVSRVVQDLGLRVE